MNKNKKIIIALVAIASIITVLGIAGYNNSMREEYELNDIAEEMFVNGKKIYTLTGDIDINIVESWLNSNNIYPDGKTERLDYYEFYKQETSEFIIVKKSTGEVSYCVNKQLRKERDYMANWNNA
ncbi:MAG: hypothetical protein ACRC1M_08060 [Methanobacteriaceae archaeon]